MASPKQWPKVRDEFLTLKAVLSGMSIGRLGDGDFPHARGRAGGRQNVYFKKLGEEMKAVLREPHPRFICAIPTMADRGPDGSAAPKYKNWVRHVDEYLPSLREGMDYYSAFITRPDSAPWIWNLDFARNMESLWRGKKVALLAREGNKAITIVNHSAKEVMHLLCPKYDAYQYIDEYERAILKQKPDVAVLSCGPTATVLSRRLATQGVHSFDIGSAGSFLCKILLDGKEKPE